MIDPRRPQDGVPSTQTSPATVIICAYTLKRWDLLERAIRSAVEQAPAPQQVVVVSDYNSQLYARLRPRYRDLTVIENPYTPGLSGARNAGLAAATGDVVAFLDDDAEADPGWLAELVRGYSEADVKGVGGWIEARWLVGRPRWFPTEFDWVVGCSYRGQPREVAFVRNMMGANMSFRRTLFDAVGGFRQELGRVGETPLGGEETELCIRAVHHDPSARFVLRPAASVRHTVPATRGTWRYFTRRCFAEGVSKAAITRSVGRAAGLASERGYATRTLPAGVVRGMRDSLRGDPSGVTRSVAIVVGLLTTIAGYVIGSVRPASGTTDPSAPNSSI